MLHHGRQLANITERRGFGLAFYFYAYGTVSTCDVSLLDRLASQGTEGFGTAD